MIGRYGFYVFWLSLTLLVQNEVSGQLTRPGSPLPLFRNDVSDVPLYFLEPVIHEKKSKAVHPDSLYLKPATSGTLIPVSYNPNQDGVWDTITDGTKIWRAAFRVENAFLMNVIFSPYRITAGVRIYLYDPMQQHVIGALSDLNNKPFGLLASAHVPGNTIIVEMHVPRHVENFGDLIVSGIGCDFTEELILKRDEWFGASGACNEDILCTSDPLIRTVKNSVVRIVFLGHERCTGSLVNTTQNNGVHYVLTAGHCFKEEDEANSAVFYFQYESPYCDGPDAGNTRSLSGATIRARSDDIDFALLELFEPVPYSYNPYYAGWDYTDNQPTSGITIHHPLGDVKKIAFEDHPLTVSSFGNLYNDNTHLLVSHWESGTTEAGSSGAPIFDVSGKIRGTLTGGLAKCDNPVKDYFQMFSHSWKDFPNPERQLAVWLDPLNKTNGSLEGNDPFALFRQTADTLTNISVNEDLSIEKGNLLWGSYSGHNNLETAEFAERFESDAEMISGIGLLVNDNYISRSNRHLNIVIWNGNEVPEEMIYSQEVMLDNFIPDTMNFIQFDSAVRPGSVFFAGFQLFYQTSQDTFSVYMAENRAPDGTNTAFVSDGTTWSGLDDYSAESVSSSFAVYPVVYGSLPVEEPRPDDYVSLYPNPASEITRILFREMTGDPVELSIINIQGQMISHKEYGPYQHVIPVDLKRLAPGIYIIRVKQAERSHNFKLSVIK